MVFSLIGRAGSGCNGSLAPSSNIFLGVLSGTGLGTLSATYVQSCDGASHSVTGLTGTYAVAGGDRTTFALGFSYLVGYLVNADEAFLIVPDNTVLAGFAEA